MCPEAVVARFEALDPARGRRGCAAERLVLVVHWYVHTQASVVGRHLPGIVPVDHERAGSGVDPPAVGRNPHERGG